MQGEIDEDVDLIGPNPLGELGIGSRRDIVPRIHQAADLPRGMVGQPARRIGMNLERRVIVMCQQRQGEKRLAMFPKIRRDVSDPQSTTGIAPTLCH